MTKEVTDTTGQDALLREHELAGERSQETHYFRVQTELVTHSTKGSVKRVDSYLELLKFEPGNHSAGEPDRFTCARFYVQRGNDPKVTMPSLEDFSYEVDKELLDQFELDEKPAIWSSRGQVCGSSRPNRCEAID